MSVSCHVHDMHVVNMSLSRSYRCMFLCVKCLSWMGLFFNSSVCFQATPNKPLVSHYINLEWICELMEPAKSKAVQPMCATDPGKVVCENVHEHVLCAMLMCLCVINNMLKICKCRGVCLCVYALSAFNELLSWMGLFDVVSQGHETGNASADQVRICGDWVVTKVDWTVKSFLPNMHAAFAYISFPKRACNVCNIVHCTHTHTCMCTALL